MSASIYRDNACLPNHERFLQELGNSRAHYEAIEAFIQDEYGEFHSEWKCYSKKSGWILKMLTKTRNILFIVPGKGYFRAVLTLGAKAYAQALVSHLPERIKKQLLDAKNYAEGRTIQLEVRTTADVEKVLDLMKIKMLN